MRVLKIILNPNTRQNGFEAAYIPKGLCELTAYGVDLKTEKKLIPWANIAQVLYDVEQQPQPATKGHAKPKAVK